MTNNPFKRTKHHTARAIVAVLVTLILYCDGALARRLIPDNNLGYPVLISLKSKGKLVGSGSGVYISLADTIYLVTAKHVLDGGLPDPWTNQIQYPDLVVELLSYSKDLPVPQRNTFAFELAAFRNNGALKLHQSRDLAAIKIGVTAKQADGSLKILYAGGFSVLETCPSGILVAGMDTIRTFDQVLIGNEAILYGYPASIGIPDHRQFDPLRPLLRKGLIAAADPQRRTLVIDGAVYRGNSGGPVFEIDQDFPQTHYYLVGITTEFIPLVQATEDFKMQFNSGYSVAEPMDFVLELIR